MDAVVLLVTSPEVVEGFRAHLDKRGAIIEEANARDASEIAQVATPDVIVAFGTASIIAALETLKALSNPVPLVGVADWKEHRALRERKDSRLGALLPKDLPPIALANRVLTLAGRAADGKPLQTTPSISPPATDRRPGLLQAKKASASATEAGAARDGDQEPRATFARVELKASEGQDVSGQIRGAKVDKPGLAGAEPRGSLGPKISVSLPAKPMQPATKVPERPEPGALTEAKEATIPPTVNLRELEVARKAEAGAPESPRAPTVSAPTRPAPQVTAPQVTAPQVTAPPQSAPTPSVPQVAAPPLNALPIAVPPPSAPQRATSELGTPPLAAARVLAPTYTTPPVRAATVAEPVAPTLRPSHPGPKLEPLLERIRLSEDGDTFPPLRLALLDVDPTRAGTLAQKLQARGVSTQLISPTLESHRWPLLRRFSPHGIVLDERDMPRSARWLEALRSDPFLGATPIILAPLSRVFDEAEGTVNLGPLRPLVAELGRIERALETHQEPGRELEFELADIRPYRLLELLAHAPGSARLLATSEGYELSWMFSRGQSGSAQLRALDGGSSLETLSATSALDWLLAHEDCRVLVRHLSGDGSFVTDVAVDWLLKSATQVEPVPEVPLRPLSARPPSLRPPSPPFGLGEPAPSASFDGAAVAAVPLRTQSKAARSPTLKDGLKELRERWRTLPPKHRTAFFAAGIVSSFALVALGFSVGGREERATEAPRRADAAPKPEPPKAPTAPPEPPSATLNPEWSVSDRKDVPACPELLGGHRQNAREATDLVALGRKQLMAGNLTEARRFFCASSVADADGPGPESLATLYLTERASTLAERWAREAVHRHPSRRPAEELLGDVLSQEGRAEEALSSWLHAIGLTSADEEKRALVSKNWTRDAQLAERGGDRPRAERYYRRAAALDRKNLAATLGLARVFLARQEMKLAQVWIESALHLEPGNADALALSKQVSGTAN